MPESSRRTDGSLSRAIELALGALSHEPGGLLTDLDGTLSPIVADPAAARLVPGVSQAMTALAGQLAVVAAITGRGPLDARRMLEGAPVLVAGNHGTEWLGPDAREPEPSPGAARAREALEGALARIPPLEGVILEDKGLSASLHVRGTAEPDAALDRLRRALGTPDGIDIRKGRMVLELRPVALGDKGTAARRSSTAIGCAEWWSSAMTSPTSTCSRPSAGCVRTERSTPPSSGSRRVTRHPPGWRMSST